MKNIKKVACGDFMMYRRRNKWQITKKGCTIPRDAKTAKEALTILRTLYALSLIDEVDVNTEIE